MCVLLIDGRQVGRRIRFFQLDCLLKFFSTINIFDLACPTKCENFLVKNSKAQKMKILRDKIESGKGWIVMMSELKIQTKEEEISEE